MELLFENGSDLLIRVNGEITGGVSDLRRTVINDEENIYQFLTDKPVARIPKQKYRLRFKMRCKSGCVFENGVESIEISDGKKTEIYTSCAVRILHSRAEPNRAVEYEVTVEARERSVANE